MNLIKSNIKIFSLFFGAFFFGIVGLIYNSQINNSWYIKYQLKMTPEVDIYSKTIDQNVSELNVNVGNFGSIIIFAQNKISKQNLTLNQNIKNFVINPETIAFNITGSLDNLDQEVEQIVSKLNNELKKEINEIINSYTQNAFDYLNLKKKIGIESVKDTIKFYENNNIKGSELSKQALEMIGFYFEKYNTGQIEREFLEKLKSELSTFDKFNSVVSLKLVLDKLEKQNNENMIQFLIIDEMKNKINSLEIFKIVKIMEQVDQKPRAMVSILSFSIFGVFITLLLIIIISIFRSNDPKKKIINFLNFD